MNPRRHPLALRLALVLTLTGATGLAQPPAPPARSDAQELNSGALAAMNEGKWEEALALFERCVADHDAAALRTFGPSFGVTWYRKGLCELRLRKWAAAADSFQTCYRRYANPAGRTTGERNLYEKRALLRWGEALQGAGDPEGAISLYLKFLTERDKEKDTFQPASFYLQLAICYLKTERLVPGIEHFETALKNRAAFQTPDSGIAAAFQTLVGECLAKKEDKLLVEFLQRNRGDIVMEPALMEPYATLFLSLGNDCLTAGCDAAGMAFLQLVPSTESMIEDLKGRIPAADETARVKFQAALERLEEARRMGATHEAVQLAATALVHERAGNLAGACACYRSLERFHPKSRNREENLYRLVRLSALTGEGAGAGEAGEAFLEAFPSSPRVAEVRGLMLSALFRSGEYETCLRIGKEMLPKLAEGSEEHDICLHALGGSEHYLGRDAAAAPWLESHLAHYPDSPRAVSAAYFQAAGCCRQGQWPQAAERLDAFLQRFPDPAANPYLPLALLDRATCDVAQENTAAALARLDRLQNDFPAAEIGDMSFNLRGNLLRNLGRPEEAEAAHRKALAIAGESGHRVVEAEALLHLVTLLSGPPLKERAKEAVALAGRFWRDDAREVSFRTRFAIAQAAAFREAGHGDEALGRLREAIAEEVARPGREELDEALRTYAGLALALAPAGEVRKQFEAMPGMDPEAGARWRVALIDALAERPTPEAGALAGELFQELKTAFKPADLPAPVLLRTAEFLREKTSAPRQALPYYDELLARKEPAFGEEAALGRAVVLASGDERPEAIESLERLAREAKDPEVRETACFTLVGLRLAAEEYPAATALAEGYLGSGGARFKPEILLMLGRCREACTERPAALQAYEEVWRSWPERTAVSLPAVVRWWDLSADPAAATAAMRGYLQQTAAAVAGMSETEKKTWRQLEQSVSAVEKSQ